IGGGAVLVAGAPVGDGGGPPVQGVIAEAADGAARVLGPEHVAHQVIADLGRPRLGRVPALSHLSRPVEQVIGITDRAWVGLPGPWPVVSDSRLPIGSKTRVVVRLRWPGPQSSMTVVWRFKTS